MIITLGVPFTFKLGVGKVTDSQLNESWETPPPPSLLLTLHPELIYSKLSIKVIKKTSLKCQCAIIKFINSAHILCGSRQMMEGQVFVARGRLAFKRTVISN